ncbi:histidine phosphatase family protein [Sphingobium sp. BHU LFT2]|uniref:histidine phosphatase family protein n=1 Tax=Sphingobium sp. BHU LFT2 TaxID=2807634 RepID=UPI001BE5EB79|nr:histidine phosphatase family protein [Sphingobium sp. BHU LFT2]MBT2243650.1 histidine phosphatase family protein [Sphingobium sp. BHU LFT2]
MSGRLFIVRHGNTFASGEPPRRVGVKTDIPLVETGELQAIALGRWFAREKITFDRVYCSPLLRTRQTAAAILAHVPAPLPAVEPASFLAEIDHGPDENLTDDAIVVRIGQNALAAWDLHAEPPPGWTVDREIRIAAWTELLTKPIKGNVLLVTSNGAARFALLASDDLAAQVREHQTDMKLRTGAWGEIVQTANGLHVAAWNQRPPARI